MARYGSQFGPDISFLGIARCGWADPATYPGADVAARSVRDLQAAVHAVARAGTSWDPSRPLLDGR